MGDQAHQFSTPTRLTYRYIHLKEIFVDFIKKRPTAALELVFKDHAGIQHKSDKFKQCDLVHWNMDMYVRTHTTATLTIRRSLSNICVAEISVKFKPNEFEDNETVGLKDSNHRVSLKFVCGRSQSLADVTRVLGSQARTALPSRVPRFLKLPQLAALLLPSSEQAYSVPYPAIYWLNNDILLDIFNCCRLDHHGNGWNDRLEWLKLSHVCQRWRHLIYKSTFHLGMRILCTHGNPIVDMLDHLPPLPLHVLHGFKSDFKAKRDELGLYHALRLHDRLFEISLHLPPSILHKCFALMDKHFPILEHFCLRVSSTADDITTLTLPKAFLAPNLRYLELPGVSLPRRLRVLTSTVSLVTLLFKDIQTSGYFRPRLLVARLSPLSRLEELSICFSIPIPRPSTERDLLGEQGIPITLPNLKSLVFRGVSTYLESLVAQIRAPLLERLDITFFNQIVFALPHLSHLINITEGFKLPKARVHFGRNEISIATTHHYSRWFDGPFSLYVRCNQLDWQIDCAAQICSGLIPALSGVQRLVLDFYDRSPPAEWENGNIDGTTWHELLSSFIGVKELYIHDGLMKELSRALQLNEVGSDPGLLPELQQISAPDNMFTSFIDTRRVVGRPVQFLSGSSRDRNLIQASATEYSW